MNLISQGFNPSKLKSMTSDLKGDLEQVFNMLAPPTPLNIDIVSKLDPG